MEKRERKPSQIIGLMLKQARTDKGMTQKSACGKLGWQETRLSEYENNKVTPGIDTIQKLAKLYDKEFLMILASPKDEKILARLSK